MASDGAPVDATRLVRRRHWARHPAVLLPSALCVGLFLAICLSWGALISRQAALIRLAHDNSGTLVVHPRKWLPEQYESRLSQSTGRLIALGLSGKRITEREAALIHGLPDLEFLMLANARVSGQTLRGLPRLDHLRLCGTDVDDAALRSIVWHVPSITRIDLSHTAVGDAGVAALARLRRIESLDLGATQITARALPALSAHPEIGTLGLSHTSIGDDDLPHLEPLTKLAVLDLRGTRVTAAGLSHLKVLRNLGMLYLDAECAQDHATQALQEALPNCIISVDYDRDEP